MENDVYGTGTPKEEEQKWENPGDLQRFAGVDWKRLDFHVFYMDFDSFLYTVYSSVLFYPHASC